MQIEPVAIIGIVGRDFVVYGEDQRPRFEARLIDGTKTLKVLWTDNLAWTLYWLRNVQRLAGGPGSFDSIEGLATDDFALGIQRGEIDESRIARHVTRALGGTWTARISRVTANRIDVMVNRTGD